MAPAAQMKSLLGLAGLFGLLSTVAAETKITYPDADSMTFYAGDSVTVKYITDYAGPKLNIFCYKDTGDGIVNPLVQTITTGTGSKTVTLDIGTGVNGCWFNIQNNNDIWGVNSPVWNYKQSRPSEQSSSSASPRPVGVSETEPTPTASAGSGSGSNGGSNGGNTAVPSMTFPNTEEISSSAALTVETAGGSGGTTPTNGSGSGSNNGNGAAAPSPQPTSGPSSGGSSGSGTSNGAGGNGAGNGANASLAASANPFVMTIDGSTTTIQPIATATLGSSSSGSTGNGNSNNANGNGSTGSSGSNGSNGTDGSSAGNGTNGGSSDNSGLSTGAKAGIGAAVAVCAVLAIVGLVFFILARRKQKRGGSQASELPAEETYGVIDKNGNGGQNSGGWHTPPTQYQNGGDGPYEMDNGHRMPELHTLERPQEVATPIGGYQRDEKKW